MQTLTFNECEDDWWTCTEYEINPCLPSIRFTLTSESEPDQGYINFAINRLNDLDSLIIKASKKILENYSYEYFLKLGVDESLLLKEETPEAMSKVVKLESVWFMNSNCKEFEMSFSVPWDLYHSFDVEFEGDNVICCAVNG